MGLDEHESSKPQIERFLTDTFGPIRDGITLGRCLSQTEQKPSPRYGIDTIYFQTVFQGSLRSEVEAAIDYLPEIHGTASNASLPGSKSRRLKDLGLVSDPARWQVFALSYPVSN